MSRIVSFHKVEIKMEGTHKSNRPSFIELIMIEEEPCYLTEKLDVT